MPPRFSPLLQLFLFSIINNYSKKTPEEVL
jgi:hypothetical protein